MVYHLVWLKAKPSVNEKHMVRLLSDVRALKNLIPSVVAVNAGSNFTDRAMGYSHGVVVVLKNQVDLESYLSHPAHIAISERLRDGCDILAMDFDDPL